MEVAPWKLRWIRVCGFMLTMFPSILTVSTTHGVPYSLQSQSISDDAPWLCRSATSMPLFWPCFLISSGAGSVVMNAITSYMFVIRLSQFVRLRLEGDDTFIAFYGVNCNPNPEALESSRYSGNGTNGAGSGTRSVADAEFAGHSQRELHGPRPHSSARDEPRSAALTQRQRPWGRRRAESDALALGLGVAERGPNPPSAPWQRETKAVEEPLGGDGGR